MLKAGAVIPLQFWVYQVDGVTPRTGLVQGDFTWSAWLDDATQALTLSDFTEIGGGGYFVRVAVPSSVGSAFRIEPSVTATPTDVLDPGVFEGVITANDIDDVAVFAARPPSVTLAQNVSPQSAFSITVFKGDGRTIQIPIYDDNGELINLTLWQNFRFSIQNTAQTEESGYLPYHQNTGVSGDANGLLSVVLPEDCSAYNSHPTGHKDTKHWWSVDANLIADGTSKTRTLRAGPFIIKSKETP